MPPPTLTFRASEKCTDPKATTLTAMFTVIDQDVTVDLSDIKEIHLQGSLFCPSNVVYCVILKHDKSIDEYMLYSHRDSMTEAKIILQQIHDNSDISIKIVSDFPV